MRQTKTLQAGQVMPMGVTLYKDYLNIAVLFPRKPQKECGIILYDGKKRLCRVPITEDYLKGYVYAVRIDGISADKLNYQFYIDGETWIDPYAKQIIGRDRWGRYRQDDSQLRALPLDLTKEYDWEGDKKKFVPYEESVLYSLHVRGFTRHPSSGVKSAGTFDGLVEKIPYLKELGVTGILCMPLYEFDEIIRNPSYREARPEVEPYMAQDKKPWKYRINYWGFADRGNYYMAPKTAYVPQGRDAMTCICDMVKEMHRNGIEVLMQIYFPADMSVGVIQEILRFWVIRYHMDGFQILSANVPTALLARDPFLGQTKIICENTNGASAESFARDGYERNIAGYTDGFRCDCRKFLKGDEGMLYSMAQKMRENNEHEALIHHITDYRGFTLYDLVSYDRKHNEENGEENRDGSDYNYSWNCGQEGPSRKKSVQLLRLSQRKNAMAMLLLGQATPMILAGDEFGHTTGGNNNAYCHDNKINWLNWNPDRYNRELLEFVKMCIAFRKAHPILHRRQPMRLMDTISCGYPDISYHADQAWYTRFENYNRHLGILLCGLYESTDHETDDFIYMALNMHWDRHKLALPQLPEEYEWKVIFSTREPADGPQAALESDGEDSFRIALLPRSITVLVARKGQKRRGRAGKKTGAQAKAQRKTAGQTDRNG